ncbi:MAG: hypothetical protein HZR80_20940 [Candidatus Heimdallarchaeota archaeon]
MIFKEEEKQEIAEVQDKARENRLVTLFNLKQLKGRLGYDAKDEFDNPYELKTTTKSGVSTARDVQFEMIEKWRNCYWIIAKGVNLRSGYRFDEIYFCHPMILEEWFLKIVNRLRIDVDLREKVLYILRNCDDESVKFNPKEIEKVNYLISRGLTLNNPKIPLWLVKKGVKIDKNAAANQLRALIKKYPLTKSVKQRSLLD